MLSQNTHQSKALITRLPLPANPMATNEGRKWTDGFLKRVESVKKKKFSGLMTASFGGDLWVLTFKGLGPEEEGMRCWRDDEVCLVPAPQDWTHPCQAVWVLG